MSPSDIQSYGPAVERQTHTPVRFAKLDPDEEGRFVGPNLVDMIRNTLPLLMGRDLPNHGTITLDPTSPNFNLSRDTKHEAIHALLMNNARQVNPAITSPDVYGQIARQLMQTRRVDNPVDEVPAYMGSFDAKQTGVPQDWRDEYIAKLQEALGKINPKLAVTFAQLSK